MIHIVVSITSLAGDRFDQMLAKPALTGVISTDDSDDRNFAMKIVTENSDPHALSMVLTLVQTMISEQLDELAREIAVYGNKH